MKQWFRSSAVALASLAVVAAMPAAAADTDLRVIVDRQDHWIEIFFGTRADNFVTSFGLAPEALVNEHGVVPFESLRQGTWTIGDDMLAHSTVRLGDAPAEFEATSLMVHPLDQALPMDNPIDALMAIAVCTAVDPGVPLTLDGLQGYAGYMSILHDWDAPLIIDLPATGRGEIEVEVLNFVHAEARDSFSVIVADGGRIEIPAPARAPMPTIAWLALMGVGGAAAGGLVLFRRLGSVRAPA